ncbi:MAG TPA: hypothetical protein VNA12_06990 [Mycobacteriales bacterium]|nr:hypothetical protein [Mycobacteriales bacterium]
MAAEPLPLESLIDLGEPDFGPAPVSPGRRVERMWRFEGHGHRPAWHGECVGCRGRHVPDRATLDEILRRVQRGKSTPPPCTCDCCALNLLA